MSPYGMLRRALRQRREGADASRRRVAALERRFDELAAALETALAAADTAAKTATEALVATERAQSELDRVITQHEKTHATLVEQAEAAHRLVTETARSVNRLMDRKAHDAHRLATETARAVEQLWQAEVELWQTIDSLAGKTDETLVQVGRADVAPDPAARS